jgi:hypothetical protein
MSRTGERAGLFVYEIREIVDGDDVDRELLPHLGSRSDMIVLREYADSEGHCYGGVAANDTLRIHKSELSKALRSGAGAEYCFNESA